MYSTFTTFTLLILALGIRMTVLAAPMLALVPRQYGDPDFAATLCTDPNYGGDCIIGTFSEGCIDLQPGVSLELSSIEIYNDADCHLHMAPGCTSDALITYESIPNLASFNFDNVVESFICFIPPTPSIVTPAPTATPTPSISSATPVHSTPTPKPSSSPAPAPYPAPAPAPYHSP